MSNLTDFQENLFGALETVPEGKVVSYGQLADMAGSPGASRAAGSAMKKDVAADYPCWRVVGADGSLHESAIGGPDAQREKLEAEGVTFKDEETVDLDASGYDPDGG